ncbi:hypothetical protein DPX16_9482 [Anabarilius grahami]|uniref:Uncharacterized protein n=1 Tax=Anabarilius grahami TaxID=495550 RepID=A0A3N0Z666_ANAGA|nr:hypothetical protein DPX16_9482 [Anabarilius grahami]
MIRWTDELRRDSTCRIGRKKADEDQLQPTVWNTLRKLKSADKQKLPNVRPSACLSSRAHSIVRYWHQPTLSLQYEVSCSGSGKLSSSVFTRVKALS